MYPHLAMPFLVFLVQNHLRIGITYIKLDDQKESKKKLESFLMVLAYLCNNLKSKC